MTPIRQLLARIRWDPEFGRGCFELAYLDRKKRALVFVPLDSIPYHRVREVWRDGERIWAR